VLLGAAVLVPCLALPPWLEYQAQLERRRAAEQYVAQLEQRVADAEDQLDHLQNDPAYLLRLGEREFGDSLDLPPGEMVRVAPSPESDAPPLPPAEPPASPELLPEFSAFLHTVLQRYPATHLFVSQGSRPIMMLIGITLLLTAFILLGKAGLPARQRTTTTTEDAPH
jgi:hypothetical protein